MRARTISPFLASGSMPHRDDVADGEPHLVERVALDPHEAVGLCLELPAQRIEVVQAREVPALLGHRRAAGGDPRQVLGIEDGHAFAQQPDPAFDREEPGRAGVTVSGVSIPKLRAGPMAVILRVPVRRIVDRRPPPAGAPEAVEPASDPRPDPAPEPAADAGRVW